MTAAERQRRYRQRQRQSQSALTVIVDQFGLADALIESGRLTEEAALDRIAVAQAAADILSTWKKTVMRNASDPLAHAIHPQSK